MKIDPSIAALKASNDELAATRQLLKETVLDHEAHRARLAEAVTLLDKHWTSCTIDKEATLNRLQTASSGEVTP